MTSFSVVSLMAIVPESEWRMPTLIVSSAAFAPKAEQGERPADGHTGGAHQQSPCKGHTLSHW